MKNSLKGALIASAVASMFVVAHAEDKKAAAPAKDKAAASVMCAGVNECKGKGECGGKGMANECKGKNECKAKGVMSMKTDKDCTTKGGKVAVAAAAAPATK